MIYVDCLNSSEISEEAYRFCYEHASEECRQRAKHCRFPEHKKHRIFSEYLLKSALKSYGCRQEPEIVRGPYGKPRVVNAGSFSYNLSHSGDWTVLAWGTQEVGIDVERIRETLNLERTIRRFFTEEEKAYIFEEAAAGQRSGTSEAGGNLEKKERLRRFTKLWVCRESYVKYRGTGLAQEMEAFWVDGRSDELHLKGEAQSKRPILQTWQLEETYILALCSADGEVCLKKRKLEECLEEGLFEK